LASFLSARGVDVRVVTAPPYYPQWRILPPYSGRWYRKERWQEIDIIRCPLWVPARPNGLTRLLHLFSFALSSFPALVAQISWRPHVILCVAPTFLNAPFVLLAARLSGAKTWLHIQDFELDAADRLGMLTILRPTLWLVRRLERWILRRFDRLSTISNRMVERLQRKGVSPQKTLLFPNWVDTHSIYPLTDRRETLRPEWQITDEDVVVLYSGNLGYKQGLEYLLQAARLLQLETHIQFVLCGDGAMRPEIERTVEHLPNVRLLPLQPAERLNQLLNSADIHVLPQRADAADLVMPSKLSGMLASGKAVIATARPETELATVVGQVGVVVPPEDEVALAHAIRHLAQNARYREDLGRAGRDWVVENWAKEKVLNNFYQTLFE
jgi:colanic acid biosynthesis glycosyl transferase WcaI